MISKTIKSLAIGFISWLIVACGGGAAGDAKNYLIVEDQSLVNLNQVEISKVNLSEPAWLVIYQSSGPQQKLGDADDIIGFKSLAAGEYAQVIVTLDRDILDNEFLYAELRSDLGIPGKFEPLGSDTLISQTSISSVSFQVFHSDEPYLHVGNGELHLKQVLVVEKIVTFQQSWVVVYTFNSEAKDNLGSILGFKKLSPGHHADAEIILTTGKSVSLVSGDKIVVGIYSNVSDAGENDNFDSNTDVLIYSEGQPLLAVQEILIPSQ